jgi:hypothetical protein
VSPPAAMTKAGCLRPDFGLRTRILDPCACTAANCRPSSEEYQNILICVKQVTHRRQCKRVYSPVVALALPSGKAVSRERSMQHGVPMRDLVADWKKWSLAERILAVMGTLLMVALPFGLLMTG